MSAITTAQTDLTTERGWGEAHARRGLSYHDLAKAFITEYPVGTTDLDQTKLDSWLYKHGLLPTLPPSNTPKNSDLWMAHLQRRHIARNKLNNAGTHPRMLEEGLESFTIEVTRGIVEVCAPHVAAANSDLARKFGTLTTTKRKQLGYLLQSADWAALPPYERVFAEEIYNDITNFTDLVKLQSSNITRKLDRLKLRLQREEVAGRIKPHNSVSQLLLDLDDPEFEPGTGSVLD